MQPLDFFLIDAFTTHAFGGNPAAVCITSAPLADAFMQNVAAELNLSETAFLVPEADGFSLRWFTPTTEVDLCGHATLASAHHLFESGIAKDRRELVFATRSGKLAASRGDNGMIILDFPATPVKEVAAPPGLEDALGVHPTFVGKAANDLLVEVAHEGIVRSAAPDRAKLVKIPTQGVIVTARSQSSEQDFVSRYFCPAIGIDEDPATGAAHCALGPYWSPRLGKTRLEAYQASRRGGKLVVELRNDRCFLSGHAVTMATGRFRGTLR